MPVHAGAATIEGLSSDIATEAIRQTTLAYPPMFITRYFKDDKNLPIKLKPFHLELIEAVMDPTINRVLIMVPAGHGKTTVVSRFMMTYLLTKNRNSRIMYIANNSTDAEQNLKA